MKVKTRKGNLILLFVSVITTIYLFWGPLFPWNPVMIGYSTISTPKATIYINGLSENDSVVYHIDKIKQAEESFHGLKYTDDFKIIILDKDSNMKRYLPWLKGSGYSVSLSLVNVIYIGPLARKSHLGIEAHLKHELSHLLIDQNATSKKALKMHEQGWFVEGIAEYFSGHKFYNKDEFIRLCKIDNRRFISLYEKNPRKMSASEIKLNYSYYKFYDYVLSSAKVIV